MKTLNSIPLASVTFVAAAIGAVIALITGDISYPEFMVGIGATGVGTGVLGQARNSAGHGTGTTN